MSKELLRQALDALVRETYGESNSTYEVIDALRAALAAPEAEPVAWRIFDGEGGYDYRDEEPELFNIDWAARYGRKYEPLYAQPAPAAPAVPMPVTDLNCPYWAAKGQVCDKCGHIHFTGGING